MDVTPLPQPLDDLAADYWAAYLEAEPTFATSIGDNRFDDRLPDITPAGLAAARGRFAAIAARAAALDPSGWDLEARITHAALVEAVASDIASIDTGLGAWNVDPVEGVPAGLLLLPDFQQASTPDDGTRMVARWRAIGTYTDAHVAALRSSLEAGRVACHAPVARTISILEELLATDDESWPLLSPLAGLDDRAWTTAERERFATGLRDAVATDVRPAFTRLHAVLRDEILPAARPDDRPGMCQVAGGADAYRKLIRVHTSLDVSAEELHAVGLAEIARIDGELADLATRTIGTTTMAEALAALRTDPALHFSSRDELFDAAVASLARANEATPDWFGRLPVAPCEVVRMAAYEEENSTIAYYRQPNPDGSRPGQYYLNTLAPETRPRYELEALTYHESVPGHHLQIAIGQELPLAATFRLHLGPTAFFEGWGLYTERLADEMGLYSGDLDRIGVLSFDAWRASRLVVDTGMHALGWTREQAIGFMLEHTALAENNIVNEVDRYIVMPGQALAYKTGQLELLRLRAEARAALGPAFDIRTFHDVVLGNGAVPLAVLGMLVGEYAEGRLTPAWQ